MRLLVLPILFGQFLFGTNDIWEEVRKSGDTLQIHLDINGVVVGQETIKGHRTPVEKYAAVMLATGTYHSWAEGEDETSYRLHVWNSLLPGPNSDQELRNRRKDALYNFVKTLNEEEHPLAYKVDGQYQKLMETLKHSPIFPGLDKLVSTLHEEKVPHHFVFRTFGGDGKIVREHLEEKFSHLSFREGKFEEDGSFRVIGEDIVISDPKEFRDFIKGAHWLIQDNFYRWRGNGEKGDFGKLFPFSTDIGDNILPMFADDNLEIVPTGDQKTIVCCYDVTRNTRVSTEEASKYLMKINPVDAALDEDHLLERITNTVRVLLDRPRYRLFNK